MDVEQTVVWTVDDDDDDYDQPNYGSTAGSPTATMTSKFSLPAGCNIRPAEVIEVVCGNQRARLDVRLLVAGLIRASNNTTSRAPCVLVDATAAAAGSAGAGVTETGTETCSETNNSGASGSSNGGSGRILTLTPNQFQKYSGRGTARDWKRSTRHHGVSLKSLIARKVLLLDPEAYGCYCNRCVAESSGLNLAGQPDGHTVSKVLNDRHTMNLESRSCSCSTSESRGDLL